MRNLEIRRTLLRELGAALKLAPWLLIVLLLTAVIWRTDLAATSGLFQSSPAEPSATPEPPTPIPTPTYTPPPDATLAPTPTETIMVTPTATIAPSDTPVPSATASNTPTLEPTMTPTVATPAASPTSSVVDSGADSETRYPEGESNLNFEWGMLFDSIALGMTYIWMCCGAMVLFAVPVGFVILWVASKRYRPSDEGAYEQEEEQSEPPQEPSEQ